MTDIVEQLIQSLGNKAVITGEDLLERKKTGVVPLALVRPSSTQQVVEVMQLCHAAGQKVVPQGGLTGLVNGADTSADEIAISLELLNDIEEVDEESRTMTVQAGVLLQSVQEEAARHGMMFPLDLGARGSATIGGNVSTNAGGNRVIRYGMMRDQILGLEVVLADGTLISSLNKIIKNNTGYDIKQLFIGAEGTLGIVTRLVLRMRPQSISQDMACVAVNEFKNVTRLLNFADQNLGGTLSAYEVLWQDFYKLVTSPPATGTPPVAQEYKYYIFLESLGGDIESDNLRFISMLESAFEEGLIADAAIASSQAERDAMWAIRDDVLQTYQNYPAYTFDISVPLNRMESYVTELKGSLNEKWPHHTCMIFGHLGDGNIHVVVGNGDRSKESKLEIEQTVYAPLVGRGGSISAEHGIGLQKKAYLSNSRSDPEMAIMKAIRHALDPKGILNQGKIMDS